MSDLTFREQSMASNINSYQGLDNLWMHIISVTSLGPECSGLLTSLSPLSSVSFESEPN